MIPAARCPMSSPAQPRDVSTPEAPLLRVAEAAKLLGVSRCELAATVRV